MRADFGASEETAEPFPSIRTRAIVPEQIADDALAWLEGTAPWRLKRTDFYEQYEFSLLDHAPPPAIEGLISPAFVESIAERFQRSWNGPALELVGVTAHRLSAGQTIRIHNDFIGPDETHRLLIQLNRGWAADQGGYLMLFASAEPESASDVLLPEHRSAFGFPISPKSYHAVSTIHGGDRFTLVYTFREPH